MSFKNILVPYENSKLSNSAFEIALDLAKDTKTKLLILHCIDKSFSKSLVPGLDFDFESIVLRRLRKKAKKDMTTLEKSAKAKGINAESYVTDSTSVAHSILSFSKSHKVDLIIMGAHTRSRITEFFLGSVSNSVLHQAKVPVLIVR